MPSLLDFLMNRKIGDPPHDHVNLRNLFFRALCIKGSNKRSRKYYVSHHSWSNIKKRQDENNFITSKSCGKKVNLKLRYGRELEK